MFVNQNARVQNLMMTDDYNAELSKCLIAPSERIQKLHIVYGLLFLPLISI